MELKENIQGTKAIFDTDVEITLKGDSLVFIFDCKNTTFNSFSNQYNSELYRGDVVEVFLSKGVKDHYYEIEVAPNNAKFIADIHACEKGNLINFLENNFVKSEVFIDGDNYRTKIEIDLNKINAKPENIKLNCFRIETEGVCENKNLFALSPTLSGTFHDRNSFLKLTDICSLQ